MSQALQANAHLVRRVADLPLEPILILPPGAPVSALGQRDGASTPEHVVILDGNGRILGVGERGDLLAQMGRDDHPTLADVVRRDFVTVRGEALLSELLTRTASAHASVAVVVRSSPAPNRESAQAVVGLITQRTMTDAMAAGLELFSD